MAFSMYEKSQAYLQKVIDNECILSDDGDRWSECFSFLRLFSKSQKFSLTRVSRRTSSPDFTETCVRIPVLKHKEEHFKARKSDFHTTKSKHYIDMDT